MRIKLLSMFFETILLFSTLANNLKWHKENLVVQKFERCQLTSLVSEARHFYFPANPIPGTGLLFTALYKTLSLLPKAKGHVELKDSCDLLPLSVLACRSIRWEQIGP